MTRAERQQFVDEGSFALTEREERQELIAGIIRQMPEEAQIELFDRLIREMGKY